MTYVHSDAHPTASEARRFERISEASATQIMLQVTSECGCEPYSDVFTFNRWKAQGFHVRKGEKATKLATYVPAKNSLRCAAGCGETWTAKKTDSGLCPKCGAEGVPAGALIPRSLSVFCRHQVEENAR